MAILVERRDGLVTVTLDRPQKKNALDGPTWVELDRTFAEVAGDPDDRALILTGAGGNFSAGADISGNQTGQGLTGRQPYRCHECGWRRWSNMLSPAANDPVSTSPDDLRTGVWTWWDDQGAIEKTLTYDRDHVVATP